MNLRKNIYNNTKFEKYRKVIFIPYHADNINHKDCETGFVSSFNDKFIFVKFTKELALFGWHGTTAKACCTNMLVQLQEVWPDTTN